jgi:hypothetical protein
MLRHVLITHNNGIELALKLCLGLVPAILGEQKDTERRTDAARQPAQASSYSSMPRRPRPSLRVRPISKNFSTASKYRALCS